MIINSTSVYDATAYRPTRLGLILIMMVLLVVAIAYCPFSHLASWDSAPSALSSTDIR